MADQKPQPWSLSKNPEIGNYGTIVDKRLRTINQGNRGYVKLSTTSTDSIINGSSVQLYYSIDNNGNVTFADIDNQGNIRRTYSNIQQIADSGQFGYTENTTLRIKDSLRTNLIQRTQNIILASNPSTTSLSGDRQGGNPPGSPSNPASPPPGDSPNSPEESSTPLDPKIVDAIENPSASLTFSPSPTGLRYPKKSKPTQDMIKFQAYEFGKVTLGSPETDQGKAFLNYKFPTPNFQPVPNEGPVYLSIQAPISDQNTVDWGSDTVNPLQSAAFSASYNLITDTGNNTGAILNDILKGIYTGAREYKSRIQKLFAAEAASINNVLARTDSAVLNPNLQLLFNAPLLRPFAFTFKLSARETAESEEIKKIINYFKYHMAVRQEVNNLFLKAPHVFKIKYIYNGETNKGQKHPGMNKIKMCALTNFSVDYTPLGSYMTYDDGTMVSYTLNMQFQEILPIYDTDYNEFKPSSNSNVIGF